MVWLIRRSMVEWLPPDVWRMFKYGTEDVFLYCIVPFDTVIETSYASFHCRPLDNLPIVFTALSLPFGAKKRNPSRNWPCSELACYYPIRLFHQTARCKYRCLFPRGQPCDRLSSQFCLLASFPERASEEIPLSIFQWPTLRRLSSQFCLLDSFPERASERAGKIPSLSVSVRPSTLTCCRLPTAPNRR